MKKEEHPIRSLERASENPFRFRAGCTRQLRFLIAGLFVAFLACRVSAENPIVPNLLDMKKATVWLDGKMAKAGKSEIRDGKISFTMGDYPEANLYRGQVIIPAELQSGVLYRLTMKITSDRDVKLPVRYILSKAPYTSYAARDVELKNGTDDYTIVFTPAMVEGKYESPRSLRFLVGELKNITLVISDLKLTDDENIQSAMIRNRCFLGILQLALLRMEEAGAAGDGISALRTGLDEIAGKMKAGTDTETAGKLYAELEKIERGLIEESKKIYSPPSGAPSGNPDAATRRKFDKEYSCLFEDWQANLAALKRSQLDAGSFNSIHGLNLCIEAERLKTLCGDGKNWTEDQERAVAFYRHAGIAHFSLGAGLRGMERKYQGLRDSADLQSSLGGNVSWDKAAAGRFEQAAAEWKTTYNRGEYVAAAQAETKAENSLKTLENALPGKSGDMSPIRPGAGFFSSGQYAFGGKWQTLPCSLAKGMSFFRECYDPSFENWGGHLDFQPFEKSRKEWCVSFGIEGAPPKSFEIADGSWTYSHRIYDCAAKTGNWKAEAWWSMLSPGVLFDAHAPSVAFSNETTGSSEAPDKVAVPTGAGVRLLQKGERIDPAKLSEGWILLIWENGAPQFPILVRFEKRPASFSWTNAALVASRQPEFGKYVAGMLYGASAKPEDWSKDWNAVPADVVQQCRLLAARLAYIPLDMSEFYAVEPDHVKVWDKVTKAIELKDDWGAKVEPYVPAPYLYTLGYDGIQFDQKLSKPLVNTKFGFFRTVPGSQMSFRIPRIRHWQRNVLKPVKGDEKRIADFNDFALRKMENGQPDNLVEKTFYAGLGYIAGGWFLMDSNVRAWFDYKRPREERLGLLCGRRRLPSAGFTYETGYLIDPVTGLGSLQTGWRGNSHGVTPMVGDYTAFNNLPVSAAYTNACYFGNWDDLKISWPYLRRIFAANVQRQGWFAPGQDCLSTGWIFYGDMLGDGYRGLAQMGDLAHAVGDRETEDLCHYLTSRTMASVASLIHPNAVAYNKAVKNHPSVLSPDAFVEQIGCDDYGICSRAPICTKTSWNAPFQSAGSEIYDYPFFGAMLENFPELSNDWVETCMRRIPNWHDPKFWNKDKDWSIPAERHISTWQLLKYLALSRPGDAGVRKLYDADFAPSGKSGFHGHWMKNYFDWYQFVNVYPYIIGQGDPAWIGGWTWAVVESGTYDRERKLIRITSRSLGDGEINLVTLIPPETVSLNGKVLGKNEFRYSPKSHSLTVPLSEGRNELCIALRKDVPAASYPALAGKASVTVDLPMSPPPGQMRGHRAIKGDLTVGACFPIDLRPFCNMGFDDRVANDGKGGTDDNGDSWLFPKGRTLVRGVPFDFINPAQNGGRSCIVLRSPRKNSFPEKVEHIPVNKVFSRLFFFHGAAYTEPGKTAFRYVLNFEGGKKRILDMKVGEQVAEWKAGAGQDKLEDIEEARAGSLFPAGRPNQWGTGVSGYVYEWRNNVSAEGVTNQDSNQQGLAKLLSIDIVSAGGAVPLVFAITGEE